MKVQKQQNEIKLTNIPETVVGVILAILLPILWVFAATEILILKTRDVDWVDIVILAALLIGYLCVLFTSFRRYRLRYAICFNENGIQEKRIFGKEKRILWKDLSEYTCEETGTSYKANERFFRIKFVSEDADRPVVITTHHFPQSKQGVFRDEIFAFCDANISKYGKSPKF